MSDQSFTLEEAEKLKEATETEHKSYVDAILDGFSVLADRFNAGEDIYEDAVGFCVDMRSGEDVTKYVRGNLAMMVKSKYGDNTMEKFAKEIKVRVKTLYDWRRVCMAFPGLPYHPILTGNENLTFSHLRASLRIPEDDQRKILLEQASVDDWTIERMEIEIDRALGKEVPPLPDEKAATPMKPKSILPWRVVVDGKHVDPLIAEVCPAEITSTLIEEALKSLGFTGNCLVFVYNADDFPPGFLKDVESL